MKSTVGVIGGGQLARMMIPPAVALGVTIKVLEEAPGMSAELAATAVGDYRDLDTVLAFAQTVDVVTFDHEHVPQHVLHALVDAGVPVRPGPDALLYAQDKLLMRQKITELGLPSPDWAAISDADELGAFLETHGGRAVVKTARGGYDGKGVRVVDDKNGADDWFIALAEDGRGGSLIVEELVDFVRELAQQVARRPSGEIVAYPVVETVQKGGVCAEVIAPAPTAGDAVAGASDRTVADEARDIAVRIAEGVGVTGMLAVELFETRDGRVLVNELAMRPHNSGHWSIDGAVTSQFEQHLRAVLDLPLGSTRPREEWSVMINVLGGPVGQLMQDRYPAVAERFPAVKLHSYAKESRPGRKVGHVTLTGASLDGVLTDARAAAAYFD
ncbi:5-(carboxyamino)imidazole ribonucleotide synthase [Gryllotalpicola koreensis]|uniref:N5-carboxyaminoimidazole ribonucleotide synthase n=1 Tax=Gryllotalpicola koreensis TaxID=993086 RepID=A0ABP8A196_9MICO